MKRLVAIVALLLIGFGAAVVYWPEEVSDAAPAPAFEAPPPKLHAEVAKETLPPPQLVAATVAGGVHRHGKGVAGARVIAKGERETIMSVTGDGGGFLLSLPPDSYLISAVFEEEASRAFGPVQLGSGAEQKGVVLELLPSATLEGVVLNEQTREPIPNARVVVAGGAALTTASGRFELKGVSVGEAWVDVSAKGFISRTEWVTVDVARRLSGMEITLSPAAIIKGTVTRAGVPVPGARVWAEADRRVLHAVDGPSTATDLSGAFELQLAVGKAQLAAAAPNEGRVEGPVVTIAAGQTLEGVQIELGQQLLVRGQVTLDADPAPGAQLLVFDARTGKPASSAVADGTGRFELLGLPPGTYLVQAKAMGVEVQRGPFQVTGTDDQWEVVLERAGVVRGRVVPAKAGTAVRLRATDWVGGGAETLTDAEGRFLFEGVTRESTVEAEGQGGYAEAKVKPNDEVVLQLEPAVIKGIVTDEHGRAITDYAIRLRPLAGGAARTHAVLSPTGRFRIQTTPGEYEVSAFAPGSTWAAPVQGTAARGGKAAEVALKLSSTTSFEARVFDSQSQQPVSGAEVQVRIGGAFSAMVFATTTTGRDGAFRFSSVPLDTGIVIFATGYKPRYLPVGQLKQQQQSSSPVQIPLERGETPEWLKSYEGVGIAWMGQLPQLAVQQVFPGSPAEEAGILRGDLLISVEGRSADTMKYGEIIDSIRGPAGTAVRLGFSRNGQPYEVSVRRRAISL